MDKLLTKEWLESEFESAFDDNTAPTGGGYEADYTDKWGFYRTFEPRIIEFSNQEKRIEAIEFEIWKLKEGWLPEEKIEIFRNTVYGNMNHDDRLTIDQLYELYINHINTVQ